LTGGLLQICIEVDFIDRGDKKSEQKDKQNTLLSNCKNTANTYKSTAKRGLRMAAARPGPSSLYKMWQPAREQPVYNCIHV